jgi:type I restriction enzyme S subunit
MKAGWEVKTLGDVCEVVNGGTPKTGVEEYWGGEHLWITPAEMGKRLSPYADYTARKITPQGLRDSSARLLPPNSVILSSRAPIGHLVINTKPMATNQGCKGLVPGENLAYKYLFYFLQANVDLLNALGTGATFKELSGGKLKEVKIPLAPSSEQQRIVGILDQAFEGIAKARANAEQNLQNARALFESHLQSVFSQHSEGWEVKTLSEVCEIKPPKNEAKKILNNSDLVSFAPMEDLGINQKYLNTIKQRALEDVAGSYTYFAEGDVLLAKITPCFENGKLGIAKNLTNGIGFGSSEYIVFRPNKSLSNEFLYYFLSRKHFIEEGAQRMSGAVGHKRVSKEFIESYKIAFPSIDKQIDLVKKTDSLANESQRLEAIYQHKIACLDELKKSLLQQAFAGEL